MRPEQKIGARVRELRLAAKLTQGELQRRLAWPQGLLGRLEKGTHMPRVETLVKVAKALGVRPGEIVDAVGSGEAVR